jgi:hypothetical protein
MGRISQLLKEIKKKNDVQIQKSEKDAKAMACPAIQSNQVNRNQQDDDIIPGHLGRI